MNRITISFLLASVHCILGIILAKYDTNFIVETIFMPYTFIAGLSFFAGWDTFSYTLIAISLLIISLIIYAVLSFFKN